MRSLPSSISRASIVQMRLATGWVWTSAALEMTGAENRA